MTLNFRTYGEGSPLLILHGLLGSLDNWASLAKRFGERFKTYIIDLRNHGQSPHSDEMNFDVMVEDVLKLIDDQQLGRVHLMGHSMGGKVAMQLALEHHQRVEKLVVVDIAPRAYPPGHRDVFNGLLAIDLAALNSREEADGTLSSYIPEPAMRQFLLKNLTRDANGLFQWRMNLDGIHHAYDSLNSAIQSDNTFTGDVLFVRGGISEYITPADERDILKLFPKGRFTAIEDAGHWVHADAPVKFAALVMEFLLN